MALDKAKNTVNYTSGQPLEVGDFDQSVAADPIGISIPDTTTAETGARFDDELGSPRGRMDRRMAPLHPSRDHELHEENPVHPVEYAILDDGTQLVAPPPRTGYRQKWVRVELGGLKDPLNYSKQIATRRWLPRPLDSIAPEYRSPYRSEKTDGFGDVLSIRGMVLCEMPIERYRERVRAVEDKNRQLTASIDKDVKNVPGLSQVRKSHTTVGRRAVPVDDEAEF